MWFRIISDINLWLVGVRPVPHVSYKEIQTNWMWFQQTDENHELQQGAQPLLSEVGWKRARSAYRRLFPDTAVPSRVCCSYNSIVFTETTLNLIRVSFFHGFYLSAVFPLCPPPCLSPCSLVCMCAYEPITGMDKPQIVHSKWSKDLMIFCVV